MQKSNHLSTEIIVNKNTMAYKLINVNKDYYHCVKQD